MIGMRNSLRRLPSAILPSILRIQKSGRLTSGIPLVVDGTKTR
jgi:hypothetical protein